MTFIAVQHKYFSSAGRKFEISDRNSVC